MVTGGRWRGEGRFMFFFFFLKIELMELADGLDIQVAEGQL